MVESTSSPSDSELLDQALAYCADQVKQFDRDRFTLCAGVSGEARRALIALFAFNLEIAKIREIVSEPMLGQIRLQWWRDSIEEIYAGTPREHAVVTALADAVARHEPPREMFTRLIDAREFDLEDRQPETIGDLASYAEATSGDLSCLMLRLLDVADDSLFDRARSAGTAWALNGLLYAVPFHAAQGRCYLPKELTDRHQVSLEKLFAGSGEDNLCRAVAEIADLARQKIEAPGQGRAGMVAEARPALAVRPLVAADLKRLEKSAYDVFSVRPTGPFRRRWLLIKGLR